MASPFLGQISIFAGNFPPRGYAACDGALVAIRQFTALFSLFGTTFGGDGVSTFGLPNLQGSVPIGMGNGPGLTPRELGEKSGTPNVSLQPTSTPAHTHAMGAFTGRLAAPVVTPTANASLGASTGGSTYGPPVMPLTAMAANVVSSYTGGNLSHNNVMPSLGLFYIVATSGAFPARN
jgi:microcystin-dependent protein